MNWSPKLCFKMTYDRPRGLIDNCSNSLTTQTCSRCNYKNLIYLLNLNYGEFGNAAFRQIVAKQSIYIVTHMTGSSDVHGRAHDREFEGTWSHMRPDV